MYLAENLKKYITVQICDNELKKKLICSTTPETQIDKKGQICKPTLYFDQLLKHVKYWEKEWELKLRLKVLDKEIHHIELNDSHK